MRSMPLLLLTLLLAVCCGRSDSDRTARIVEYWQGREISLPSVMTDVLTGDTIDISVADFTIMTYVDSVGCTGCKMKLPLWKEFLGSLDGIADTDVRFLMVVYPFDGEELRYILKQNGFHYPVYSDADCHIFGSNPFPDKTQFQTFLLDRNRKVLAVGNPVYSSEIGNLYKSILSGKTSFSPELDNMVMVSDNRIRLGNLRNGESAIREIVFSNAGNDTVRIKEVLSSCDCTDLTFTHGHIPPRSDLGATLVFSGDTIAGEFERTIHVYYKDFEYPTVINVYGNIIY